MNITNIEFQKCSLTEQTAKSRIQLMISHLCGISNSISFADFTTVIIKGQNISISDEVEYLVQNGTADKLQYIYDLNDKVFCTLPTMGVINNVSGTNIELSTTLYNQKKTIKNKGFIERPEESLSRDISSYKETFNTYYNNEKYESCFRSYRSYLLTSTSLLDLFLNRYILYAKNENRRITKDKCFKTLDSRASLEKRIDAWFHVFTEKTMCYKFSKEWNDFMRIKKSRNELVHTQDIGFQYDIKDMIKVLNASINGLGGLLFFMHTSAKNNGYLGFIQRLLNQGKFTYQNLT